MIGSFNPSLAWIPRRFHAGQAAASDSTFVAITELPANDINLC
jgi:hypothetical protein